MNIPDSPHILQVHKEITYFQYPKLSLHRQLVHRVFTRHGGVSEPPFNTFNTSYDVGDQPGNVAANLLKIKKAIGAKDLVFMNQSHGCDIQILCKDHIEGLTKPLSADAIITDAPGIALMVKQADCQGVIIFDPKKNIVANVHCGWRGNIRNIVGRTVKKMKEHFDCREPELLAAIGPSLGPCCAEFLSYDKIFPKTFKSFMIRKNYFDLWSVSCQQLKEAGLTENNIEVGGICTRCNSDTFFSYRAEGKTGRFGTVAMLR